MTFFFSIYNLLSDSDYQLHPPKLICCYLVHLLSYRQITFIQLFFCYVFFNVFLLPETCSLVCCRNMCCIYCIRVWVIILVTPCIILLFSLWWHSVCIMLSQEVPIHTIFSAVISISPFKKNGKNTFHDFRHIKYIVLASMFLNTNQNSIGNVVNIAPADLTIPGQKGFPGQFF